MAPVALGDHEAAVDELSQVHARGGGRDAGLGGQHAGGQLAAVGQRAQHARAARIADEGAHAGEIGVPGHAPRVAARRFVLRRSLAVLRSSAMTSQRRTLTLVVMCVGMFLVLLDVTVVNVALPRLRADLGAGVRQPAVDRRRLRRRPGLADAPVRRPRRPPRPQARRARRASPPSARVRWRPGWPPGRRCSSPGASCRARAPRCCCPARSRSSRARTRTRPSGRGPSAIWAAISSLALPAGVIAGGALVDGPGWRWAFLVNLPVVAVALPVTARVVRESREPTARRARRPGRRPRGGAAGTVTFAIIAARPRPARRPPRCWRPWWRSSAGAASRCCPRRSSAGRPSSPPTPSPRR